MNRAEAEKRAELNAQEHADRATHRWIAQHVEGEEWRVVRIRVPTGMRVDPLKASIETKPKPPEPDDPRPAHQRDAPGAWG